MADPWDRGSSNGYVWHTQGFQLENGIRIEGIPGREFVDLDVVTGILIGIHPEGDEEASRYFWVFNPLQQDPETWLNMIRATAARYGISLE
jgi:hypothetical protein